jgi:hypothetical protein
MNGSHELEGLIEEGEALRRFGIIEATPARSARSARVFHSAISIALLATAIAGFAPTYFLRGLSDRPPLSPLVHVHGAVFTSWLVLLVVQSALVSARRVDWHRRLGIAGAVIAAVMVPLGVMTVLAAGRTWLIEGPRPVTFIIFPLGQIVLFAVFVGAALWKRRDRELHRRLILLATIATITPAINRIVGDQWLTLALTALFVIAGIVHDWKTHRRVHPVYLKGGLILLLSGPLRFAVSQTAAWERIARSLVE